MKISPVDKEEEDQLKHIDTAWRNAVTNQVTEGSAILIREKDLGTIDEAMVTKIINLCSERVQEQSAKAAAPPTGHKA